jgi:hypothetical protein
LLTGGNILFQFKFFCDFWIIFRLLFSQRFGEGLKLAMLTGLRLGKPLCIYTGGAIWTSALRQAAVYENHVCLHHITTPDPNTAENANKVRVVIDNISRAEWTGTTENNTGIHGFIRLISACVTKYPSLRDSDPIIIHAVTPGVGKLLLSRRYQGRIFNNGVFVRKFDDFRFGYDLVNLTPNRDRSVLINHDEQRTATSNVIGEILEFQRDLRANGEIALLINWPQFREAVYQLLLQNGEETHHLHIYFNNRVANGSRSGPNAMYDYWENSNPSPNPDLPQMPHYGDTAYPVKRKMEQLRISESAYPMWINCSWELWHTLILSDKFKTLEQRVTDLENNVEYVVSEEERRMVESATNILGRFFVVDVAVPQIKFKHFAYSIKFSCANAVYLSREILIENQVRVHETGISNNPIVSKIVASIVELRLSNLAVAFSKMNLQN